MSKFKVLVILSAFLIGACSVNEPSKFVTAEVDGFKIRTDARRVVSYKPGGRPFLRIKFNAFDLVLDSRLPAHTEADFMSVIPTDYGNGKSRVFGAYKLLCTNSKFNACGYKFTVNNKFIVLAFDEPPTSELDITRSISQATSFLNSREAS
jgi:hypothetical protein